MLFGEFDLYMGQSDMIRRIGGESEWRGWPWLAPKQLSVVREDVGLFRVGRCILWTNLRMVPATVETSCRSAREWKRAGSLGREGDGRLAGGAGARPPSC